MSHSKFRPLTPFAPGFIANKNGGSAWKASGPRPDLGDPVLIVTVDLATSALSRSIGRECRFEIPLFSYMNLDGLIPVQEYALDHGTRTATLKPFAADVKSLPVQDRLPAPFPESVLRLREMREDEIPRDEKSYWTAIDSFLGGEGVIRLCGAPVYIDSIAPAEDGFSYFASIGYELPGCVDGFLGGEAFFPGEIAHYFFVSADWNAVRVVSQAS
jgi:hypothetical protein